MARRRHGQGAGRDGARRRHRDAAPAARHDAAVAGGSERPDSTALRLETLERLGGAERDRASGTSTRRWTRSHAAERDAAARIFQYLVTPAGTKIALGVDDLQPNAGLSADELRALLVKLSSGESRILTSVAPAPDQPARERYQIFHDVLAQKVLDWRSRYVRAAEQRAAEAVAQEQRDEPKKKRWPPRGCAGCSRSRCSGTDRHRAGRTGLAADERGARAATDRRLTAHCRRQGRRRRGPREPLGRAAPPGTAWRRARREARSSRRIATCSSQEMRPRPGCPGRPLRRPGSKSKRRPRPNSPSTDARTKPGCSTPPGANSRPETPRCSARRRRSGNSTRSRRHRSYPPVFAAAGTAPSGAAPPPAPVPSPDPTPPPSPPETVKKDDAVKEPAPPTATASTPPESTSKATGDYREVYRRGINAKNRRQWKDAANLFQQALQLRSTDTGERISITGFGNIEPYVPHYYLGLALMNLNDCAGALRNWELAEQDGAIQKTSLYETLESGRKKCGR